MDYTSLGKLVGSTFSVQKVGGIKFQKWDDVSEKYMTSDKPQQGYSKKYEIETDKGKLDLGIGQVGSLLEAVFKDGVADLNGKTFLVKSNGKTGKDIRYYYDVTETGPLADVELNGGGDYDGEFDQIPF
jgi:hypothetical protein